MKLFGVESVYTALLLVTSVNAFSSELSKRALKYDNSCNTKYGKLTAKQLIDKSIDIQPKLAKAGVEGLDAIIYLLESQSEVPTTKKPSISRNDLNRILATYRVLFGDIRITDEDETPNPDFNTEAAEHIAAIKETRDSLQRMTKSGKPNLMIHCNDDWLSARGPKSAAASKPKAAPKPGHQYLYNTDRKQWVSVKGGKPCQGNKAIVTSSDIKTGKSRDKGPESITFCVPFLKQQNNLEKDKQAHLWDISKTKLPTTFTTYTKTGTKDATLDFHISAFGTKIGAKWFSEFMHTKLFNPTTSKFTDKTLSGGSAAVGFKGAVELAKLKEGKNIAETSRNIETVLYWSLAMYYDKWLWSTGNPENPTTLSTSGEETDTTDTDSSTDFDSSTSFDSSTDLDSTTGVDSTVDTTTDTSATTDGTAVEARSADRGSLAKRKFKLPGFLGKPKGKTPDKPIEPPKAADSPKAAEPPKAVEPPKDKPAEAPKDKPAEAPKDKPAEAPKTEKPADSPKTDKPTEAAKPTNNKTPPPSPTKSPASISTPLSGKTSKTSSGSHSSCSNTLCTRASRTSSSASATASDAVPLETFESEPMNAGSMTEAEILAISGAVAAEQPAAIAGWGEALSSMGLKGGSGSGLKPSGIGGDLLSGGHGGGILPGGGHLPTGLAGGLLSTGIAGGLLPTGIVGGLLSSGVVGGVLPTGIVGGAPSVSVGTGMPMATGGAGGAANGTWSMPKLKVRERMIYDFAS